MASSRFRVYLRKIRRNRSQAKASKQMASKEAYLARQAKYQQQSKMTVTVTSKSKEAKKSPTQKKSLGGPYNAPKQAKGAQETKAWNAKMMKDYHAKQEQKKQAQQKPAQEKKQSQQKNRKPPSPGRER